MSEPPDTLAQQIAELEAAFAQSDGDAGAGEAQDSQQSAAEERIRHTVQNIVDGIVGPGAVLESPIVRARQGVYCEP